MRSHYILGGTMALMNKCLIKKENFINKKSSKQFISYLFVGSMATIVEWIGFVIFNEILRNQYLLSTILAFCASTQANLILGRRITFKSECKSAIQAKELISIYVVSAIGLLLNLLLMYLLVSKASVPAFISKIIATGIVFFWNFGIRKFVIYLK